MSDTTTPDENEFTALQSELGDTVIPTDVAPELSGEGEVTTLPEVESDVTPETPDTDSTNNEASEPETPAETEVSPSEVATPQETTTDAQPPETPADASEQLDPAETPQDTSEVEPQSPEDIHAALQSHYRQ